METFSPNPATGRANLPKWPFWPQNQVKSVQIFKMHKKLLFLLVKLSLSQQNVTFEDNFVLLALNLGC